MKTILLNRGETGDQGAFGRFITPWRSYYTVELPWLENKQRVSCIPSAEWCIGHGFCLPEGIYHVEMRRSPKFGWMYWIKDVPGRSFCLVHPANFGGNVEKGFLTHLEGCIGLGMNIGWLEGQKAVLRSRPAVIEFMNMMNREPFMLKIVNAFREAA